MKASADLTKHNPPEANKLAKAIPRFSLVSAPEDPKALGDRPASPSPPGGSNFCHLNLAHWNVTEWGQASGIPVLSALE